MALDPGIGWGLVVQNKNLYFALLAARVGCYVVVANIVQQEGNATKCKIKQYALKIAMKPTVLAS